MFHLLLPAALCCPAPPCVEYHPPLVVPYTIVLPAPPSVPPASSTPPKPVAAPEPPAIITPPAALKLDLFYEKYLENDGLPVVASKNVSDDAVRAAADILNHMLADAPELRKALVRGKARVALIGKSERTTELPEYRNMTPRDYWDGRARGFGGSARDPLTSVGEENVLNLRDDRYRGESILIHEFGHAVHGIGMRALDRTFDDRLKKAYEHAMSAKLWEKTYAATNRGEYWAEGVQSYFDSNQYADPPNGIHNKVSTRDRLKEYDPDLYALVKEAFGDNPWRWSNKPPKPAAKAAPQTPTPAPPTPTPPTAEPLPTPVVFLPVVESPPVFLPVVESLPVVWVIAPPSCPTPEPSVLFPRLRARFGR